MLEVVNLTKIFKSKKKETNIALNNVSFRLPETGFAFIVGKSGSGKTTLLSLIGGLEDVTSGEIIYHGNKLSEFKHSEFDVYRNNEVGFIFQDYHLLEELSIFENIKMMLDFKRIKDDARILKALESVGLKGYENRYPKELSGGEKQRVAIARILVKDPSIILADEPTGNLDRETTKQILDLLKNISKNKLVLIVSHNKYDAYNYGDYILKIDNGQIVEKLKRNELSNTKYHVENNVLYLSKDKKITEEEKENILTKLKSEELKELKYNESVFEKYNENFQKTTEEFKDKKKHISFFKALKYSFSFAKKSLFKILISSLVIGTVISLASLCNRVSNINENEIRENFYRRNDIDFTATTNSIIHGLVDNEYKEEIRKIPGLKSYEFYPSFYDNANIANIRNKLGLIDIINVKVLIVDDELLLSKFGARNKLEFVAKNPIQDEHGFYITDELLSYLNAKDLTDEIVDDVFKNGLNPYKINGIIKTDLHDRFSKILAKVNKFNPNLDLLTKNETSQYINYIYELQLLHFNLLTKKLSDYNYIKTQLNNYYFPNGTYIKNGLYKEFKSNFSDEKYFGPPSNLTDDEIIIRYDNYEQITGKKFDYHKKEYFLDEPFDLSLQFYSSFDPNKKHLLYEKTYKVVGVSANSNFVNSKNYEELFINLLPTSELLFIGIDKLQELSKVNEKLNYEFFGVNESSIYRISRAIEPLKDLFEFLSNVLVIIFILTVIFYFAKSFNTSLFEIGVMKALGARDKDIVNMMFINFITCLGSTLIIFNVLSPILSSFTNDVLNVGIKNVVTLKLFQSNFNLFPLNINYFLIINALIILTFLLSFLIQFIRIRRLKPINIIKAKE